jgi:hypothetical protein
MATRTSLYSDNKITQCLDPAVTNSDTDCTAVDMNGYNECFLLVNVGESADTLNATNKIELEVEESSDNITFTDVADADLVNYVAGTNDGTFALIDAATEDDTAYFTAYRGNSPYVRVVLNFSGTHTTGTPISVTAIQKALVVPENAVTTQ